MRIQLPEGQNAYLGVSSCVFEDGQACTVVSFDETDVKIVYRSSQKVILKNILNYHTN